MYKNVIKRLLDILAALIGLCLLLPIILILIVVLAISLEGSPFFVQARPGKSGTIFHLIKFKSMTDETDEHGELLPYHLRVTKLGKFIRTYSLDEIPQLLNVLKGDMSLIGPRPLLPEYLEHYNKSQMRRHEVLPGITGWAQVNGRNAISWEQKFNYDIYYVDHVSFALDYKIFLKTIDKVINRKDVNNAEDINMPKFTGTK